MSTDKNKISFGTILVIIFDTVFIYPDALYEQILNADNSAATVWGIFGKWGNPTQSEESGGICFALHETGVSCFL